MCLLVLTHRSGRHSIDDYNLEFITPCPDLGERMKKFLYVGRIKPTGLKIFERVVEFGIGGGLVN
jgi:hypothetical protein